MRPTTSADSRCSSSSSSPRSATRKYGELESTAHNGGDGQRRHRLRWEAIQSTANHVAHTTGDGGTPYGVLVQGLLAAKEAAELTNEQRIARGTGRDGSRDRFAHVLTRSELDDSVDRW